MNQPRPTINESRHAMQTEMNREHTWATIHAEREALVADLADIDTDQWATPSLCEGWTVEDAVAHLTAGALETRFRWMLSVIRARFDFDKHNRRRLNGHLGGTPEATLSNLRSAVSRTTAASGHHWAWLGEIVVHGEDIRRPLGIAPSTPPQVAAEVARHFAEKNFTVPSKTHVAGLRLRANDSGFEHGDGPEVTGPTLSLLMAMSGRTPHLDDLEGDGVPQLASALK